MDESDYRATGQMPYEPDVENGYPGSYMPSKRMVMFAISQPAVIHRLNFALFDLPLNPLRFCNQLWLGLLK